MVAKKIRTRLSLLLAAAMISVPIGFAGAASDINGHWAEKEIGVFLQKGDISGYPDGSFKPDNTITRAEFISLLNREALLAPTPATGFSDVTADDWYSGQIGAAVKAGYVSGYPDGMFHPNETLTREQAAAMLTSLLHLQAKGNDSKVFTDQSQISVWAGQSVLAAIEAGALSGYPDGSFQPQKGMTRAETVVMVSRVLHYFSTIQTQMEQPSNGVGNQQTTTAGTTASTPTNPTTTGTTTTTTTSTTTPTQTTTTTTSTSSQYVSVGDPNSIGNSHHHSSSVVEAVYSNGVYKASTGNGEISFQGEGGRGANPDGIIDSAGCIGGIHVFQQGTHLAFATDIQSTDPALTTATLNPVVEVWTTDSTPTLVQTIQMAYGPHPPSNLNGPHFWTAGLQLTDQWVTGDYSYRFVVNGQYAFTPQNHIFTVQPKPVVAVKGDNGVYTAPTGHGEISFQGEGGRGANPDGIIDSAGCIGGIHVFQQGTHLAFATDIQSTDPALTTATMNPVVEIWSTGGTPTLVQTIQMTYGPHPPSNPAGPHFWTAGLQLTNQWATGDYTYKFVVNNQYVFVPENNTLTITAAQQP
jgi:hypothetical protein